MRFLLGGYSAGQDGRATGIGILAAGVGDEPSPGGPLGFVGDAVRVDGSPSWVTRHPSADIVYAALEGIGAVQGFRRTGETSFAPLGAPVAVGESVCHVAVAPDGGSLIASCWGDGRVVRLTLDAAGRPSSPAVGAAAVDPYGDGAAGPAEPAGGIDLADAARALREAAGGEFAHLVPFADPESDAVAPPTLAEALAADRVAHAHQAVFLPGGLIATTDMGFDLVRFWTSGLELRQDVVLPLGSGPRHMVWHPSGHLYVLSELSHEVFVLAPDVTGAWRIVGGTPVGPVLPDDTAAELCPSRDAEFLYAGVRGSNTIAALSVRGDGSSLQPVALVDAGVDWPRHHAVVRDTLLVAGQRSDEVVSMTLDTRTGVPGRIRHRTIAPSPTCLVPFR